ncbi:MAG: AAA family ATPase [bacterium]|nr:AAA family ATPase [bacterium]
MKLYAFIMRGVPGSGKSSVAKKLAGRKGVVHSADKYRYKRGKYHFDHAETFAIYEKNFKDFCKSLAKKISVVICDNTNVLKADFLRYVVAAEQAGYYVAVVTLPHPDPVVASKRNQHRVPVAVIQKKINDWEHY